MDKTEFLDQLRMSLSGKMEADQVSDNLRYYEDYIDSQVRMGYAESDVMSKLGSPRLIARSITDAWMQGAPQEPADYRESRPEAEETSDRENGFGAQLHIPWLVKFFTFPKWLRTVIGVSVFFLVLWIVFTILKFLFPVIMMTALAVFLIKLFRDWLN